jgi:hypothetical protein
MNEPAVMEVPNKTFPFVDYERNTVIERHIIFMVRRWQELLITV